MNILHTIGSDIYVCERQVSLEYHSIVQVFHGYKINLYYNFM